MWLAALATGYYTPKETDITEEGPVIYMQVYYNEKIEDSWGISTSYGKYAEAADIVIQSWLINGATAADCAKFPKMP
jgi:hypothetical protein